MKNVDGYLKNFIFFIVITSFVEASILPVCAQEAALFKSAIEMFDLWAPRIGGVAGVVSIICSFNECKKEKIPPKQVEPPQHKYLNPFSPYNFSTSSLFLCKALPGEFILSSTKVYLPGHTSQLFFDLRNYSVVVYKQTGSIESISNLDKARGTWFNINSTPYQACYDGIAHARNIYP